MIKWWSRSVWCLWLTVTQDSHIPFWILPHHILALQMKPHVHPQNFICQVRRWTEKSKSFTLRSKQTMLFLWRALIDWFIETIAWPGILVYVIPTVVYRGLAFTFHFSSPVPLCCFTFLWEDDKHKILPWNRFICTFCVNINTEMFSYRGGEMHCRDCPVGACFLFQGLSQRLVFLMCSHQRQWRQTTHSDTGKQKSYRLLHAVLLLHAQVLNGIL